MHVFDDSHIAWNSIDGIDHLQFQVCEVDVASRTADILFKFDAHSKSALHLHRAPYRTLVLQGELRLYRPNGELKEVRPVGSYVRVEVGNEPHMEGGGDQDVIVFFSFREVDGSAFDNLDDARNVIAVFGLAEFAEVQKGQKQGFVRGVTVGDPVRA